MDLPIVEKEFDIEDIEVVKAQSVYERASVFLYRSGEELKMGNVQNFINIMAWIEATLTVKLEKSKDKEGKTYFDRIRDKRKELNLDRENTPENRLALALYKLSELNRFMDKKLPIAIEGEI